MNIPNNITSGHKAPIRSLRSLAFASASALSLVVCAGAAQAQSANASKAQTTEQVEEVVITASRLQVSGFSAPTPTTVVGTADIERAGQPNIFNAITQLPSLQGSSGTATGNGGTSGGGNGLSAFNMRGLGSTRVLTLLDGQRIVPANVDGTTDISALPQLLVKRVDIVTGGASASYGSDAIAGVINFVTDTRFSGFKYNLQGGITNYGDGGLANGQVAFGRSFADGRAHIQAGAEYMFENGIGPNGFGVGQGPNGRGFYKAPQLQIRSIAATAAGSPQITKILNGQGYQYSLNGLITAGPLQGIAFGDRGAPYQFQYGSGGVPSRTASGSVSNCINPFCVGGDNSAAAGNGTSLSGDLTRTVAYTRVSYEVNSNLEVFATMNLAEVKTSNQPNPGARYNANLTIQCSNPYLDASVRASCATAGITSFQFGTYNGNYPADITVNPTRKQRRFVVGADGSYELAGKEWKWNTYYQMGRSDTFLRIQNMTLRPRFVAAIDAAAGPNGTIVCRSAIAAASGCVPYNALGNVTNTDAAWKYIAPLDGPTQDSDQEQDAFSISTSGAPMDLWAGPLAVAFGFEWRREAYTVKGDPYGNGVSASNPNNASYPADPLLNAERGNNWYAGNFHDGAGEYTVKEAFGEIGFSAFDNDTLGKADIQLAGRVTDYSTSGRVETWKVGGVWDTPVEGIRLRAVRSRDIRAPNLGELFAAPQVANGVVLPPGGTSQTVLARTEGNPDLKPERSITSEFGVVLQPSWLRGFQFSVDYYKISVTDAIASLGLQQTVDLCTNFGGSICTNVFLTGTGVNQNFVRVQQRNLSKIETSGLDLEASYRLGLDSLKIPGSLTLRALATNVREFITDSGIPGAIPVESAGVNSGPSPDWKVLAQQTYENDRLSFTVIERWISDGVFNSAYIQCNSNCPLPTANNPTINDNHLDGALYIDVAGNWKLNETTSLYFKVNNMFDIDPEPIPSSAPNNPATNPTVYDTLGRLYRIGVRATF